VFGNRKKNFKNQTKIGCMEHLNEVLSTKEEKYLKRQNKVNCKEINRIINFKEAFENFYEKISGIQKFHTFKITKDGIFGKEFAFDNDYSENLLKLKTEKLEEIKSIKFFLYEENQFFDDKLVNNCHPNLMILPQKIFGMILVMEKILLKNINLKIQKLKLLMKIMKKYK